MKLHSPCINSYIYWLGIHILKSSKKRNIVNKFIFDSQICGNVWQCKMSPLMWFTLTLSYPKMNVKSWVKRIGTEKEKGNIFTQTYLYFSYDWKWNSAEQIENITLWEYNTTFAYYYEMSSSHCYFCRQFSYIYL
jgi:hypothetical protein